MSTGAESRYAAAAFVALLLLSIVWPSPVVSANFLLFHHHLDIDDLSFLGREAPSWDIVFWCIAGLFAIAIAQTAEATRNDIGDAAREVRAFRPVVPRHFWIAIATALVVVPLTWLALDSAIVAFAEKIESQTIEDIARYFNRLGGGINPAMIVLFFVVAGVAYRQRRWFAYGVAMALAGIAAGAFAQIVKFAVGRTRPELWLGAMHHARGNASFPSGHTIAAFSIGGVLMMSSRSVTTRVIVFALACGVAAARVFAFRHWPSDVLASALIGLMAAWIACASVERRASSAAGDARGLASPHA